jgi:uncharacterized protein YifE (UPF0438 family)
MKKIFINKSILKLNYFQLKILVEEYKGNLFQYTKNEKENAKRVLKVLTRYLLRIQKKEKIETLTEMKNRTIEKYKKKDII